ncbi:hypothetical protein [Sanyastnella coralliicola]|uniref:hypothetical protein n=1 Tax=Sanyastnella coralliicola TaxID=3069118 RepID=UPI0027BA1575|nr:hypothetical protein [Longitalea sp. SCSIO 12813]
MDPKQKQKVYRKTIIPMVIGVFMIIPALIAEDAFTFFILAWFGGFLVLSRAITLYKFQAYLKAQESEPDVLDNIDE